MQGTATHSPASDRRRSLQRAWDGPRSPTALTGAAPPHFLPGVLVPSLMALPTFAQSWPLSPPRVALGLGQGSSVAWVNSYLAGGWQSSVTAPAGPCPCRQSHWPVSLATNIAPRCPGCARGRGPCGPGGKRMDSNGNKQDSSFLSRPSRRSSKARVRSRFLEKETEAPRGPVTSPGTHGRTGYGLELIKANVWGL